jgi:hypothetical protein
MKYTIKSVGGGVVADVESHELAEGQWSYVLNTRMRDGYAWKTSGHIEMPITQPTTTPRHVAYYRTPTKNFWIWSDDDNTYADDGTTQTDITGTALTGDQDSRFTHCYLGGIYIQNNQTDTPRYWDGNTANNLASLTDWNSGWRCKSLRSFKNYLLALNVTKSGVNYPHMVKWSHAAEPGALPVSWDITDATLDAGERDLAETTDHIVDGLALGDTFVVYKERSMHGLQYVGGNTIFRSFRLPGNYGALSQNCVAQTPIGHVILTPGPDLVVHNGGEPQSVLSGRMRRWLSASIDAPNCTKSFVVANLGADEVWVCYPTEAGCVARQALIWNYRENTFSVRELPRTASADVGIVSGAISDPWDSSSGEWDLDTDWWNNAELGDAAQRMAMASWLGKIYLMDQSTRFDGSDFTAQLERTGLVFGDPWQVKTIRSIYPRIDGSGGAEVEISVGGAMDVEGPYTWSDPVTYTIGRTYRADSFATGRFLAMRVRSKANGRWRIRSIDVELVPRGTY